MTVVAHSAPSARQRLGSASINYSEQWTAKPTRPFSAFSSRRNRNQKNSNPVANSFVKRKHAQKEGRQLPIEVTSTVSDLRQAAVRIVVRDNLDQVACKPMFDQLNQAIEREKPLRTLILGEPIGASVCQALAESLRSTFYTSLKRICMWRAAITDAGFLAFCRTLPNLHQLVDLDLIDCELDDMGACCNALASALTTRNAPRLTKLALDYNGIGTDGLRLLQAALCRAVSNGMRTLSLGFCNLSADSGAVLASLLAATKSSLKTLNLEGNRLCDDGLAALSGGLKLSSSMMELNVGANQIGTPYVGLERFCEALKQCRTLRTVDLDGNALNDDAIQLVLETIRSSAHVLDLRVPKWSSPALFHAVMLALHQNRIDSHQSGVQTRPKSGKVKSEKKREKQRQKIIEEFLRSQQERRIRVHDRVRILS